MTSRGLLRGGRSGPAGPRFGGHASSLLAALTSAAFLAAAVVAVPGARAVAAVPPPPSCVEPLASAASAGATRSAVESGTVVILGQSRAVDLHSLDLRRSPFPDVTRALLWRSIAWLAPAYWPDLPDGQVAGSADPIADLVSAMARDPDPGSSTAAALRQSQSVGWDEATNARRERSLSCLYALTHDTRLVPLLNKAVAVNKDANRYYGPPHHLAHNHGTYANLALLDTAVVMGDDALARFAAGRLAVTMPLVFTPVGFTIEQSTDYLQTNLALWTEVHDKMTALGLSGRLPTLDPTLLRARSMLAQLTGPSGWTSAIGDSRTHVVGVPAPQARLFVHDSAGGVSAGRWSWTDPDTSWWTLRYGGRRVAHGHDDQGSLTWSTLGTDVLVDPGTFAYDTRTAFFRWQRSPGAHNVAVPATAHHIDASSPLTSWSRSGAVDRIGLRVGSWSVPVKRAITVDDARHRVTLVDTVPGVFSLHLHLDASWTFVRRTNRTWLFRNQGHRLSISVTKAISGRVLHGSSAPLGGWVFGAFERATPACELVLTTTGSLSTTLTVS